VVTGTVSGSDGRPIPRAIVDVLSSPSPLTKLKREAPTLVIRDARLEPQVLVVMTNETFTVTNSDDVPHNVHFRFREGRPQTLKLPAHEQQTVLWRSAKLSRVCSDKLSQRLEAEGAASSFQGVEFSE
jgi:hypothetical protein